MNEEITRLQEKIAYLERHVIEQDKAMLEMGDELAALRREMRGLRDRVATPASDRDAEGDGAPIERPPHY